MKTLSVCVGSSCHLKGAYAVIRVLQRLLQENQLQEQVELKATFCLGQCQAGVTLALDGVVYTSITKENVEEFFNQYVLAPKGKGEK